MGWAERANPNSMWNKKRRGEYPFGPRIEQVLPDPTRKTFWQRILNYFRRLFVWQ